MNIDKLIFPIIIIKQKDNNIYKYEKRDELTKTTEEILKEGVFKRCVIVDYFGNKFEIIEAFKIKYAGWIRGWNPLYKGTSIIVDFKLSEPTQLNKESLLELLGSRISKLKRTYPDVIGIEEISTDTQKAVSIQEIINLIPI